ncbi:TetR/AcrR family transcriptional regulator [Parafrankia soli]|uniref:TetR/AcrR family transcriptional regulator n=1 Tax=Parafrankia soli TaxID=2599596 RepID=UPI0008D91334|nr:TetR/AcrR family transcriptional regulator [Parafrankia soli]
MTADGKTPPRADRARRTDAQRNENRLVEAAREVFIAQGTGAPLSMVAQRAKVGPATLYRHFANREALVNAAFRVEITDLCHIADELNESLPPGEALRGWLEAATRHTVTMRGPASDQHWERLWRVSYIRWPTAVCRAGGAVLGRAQAAGAAHLTSASPTC